MDRVARRIALSGSLFLLIASNHLARGADAVRWMPSLDAAQRVAAEHNVPVLVHFWSDDCLPCRIVDRDVFSRAEVGEALLRGFVPVKLNAREYPEVAHDLGVDRWPTDVVLGPDGRILGKTVSPQDPQQYLARVTQIVGRQRAMDQLAQHAPQLAQQATPPPPAGAVPQGVSWNGNADRGQAVAGAPSGSQLPEMTDDYHRPPAPPQQYTPTAQQGYAQVSGANEYAYGAPPRHDATAQRQYQPTAPSSVAVTDPADQMIVNPYVRSGAEGGPPPHSVASQATASQAYGTPADTYNPSGANWSNSPPTTYAANETPSYETGSTSNGYGAADHAGNAATAAATETAGGGEPPLGMDGFCPVTLADEGRWAEGSSDWGAVHRGRVYLFASQDAQRRFMANPDSFSPMLAGYDPVVFAEEGRVIEGKRAHGIVFKDQVFLFANEDNLRRFWDSPHRYEGMVLQAMGVNNERLMR